MTNKKNISNGEQPEVTPPLGELEQLRQIVFGDAQQQLITQMTTMRNDFEQAMQSHEKAFSTRLDKMQEAFDKQLSSLDQRIQIFDKTHDEHEASLQKDIENLASEHEMLATTTQEDFKTITQCKTHHRPNNKAMTSSLIN